MTHAPPTPTAPLDSDDEEIVNGGIERDNTKRWPWWVTTSSILVVLYALGGWPLAFLEARFNRAGHPWLGRPFGVLGYPHFVVACHHEPYYHYMIHGTMTGIDAKGLRAVPWEEFRKDWGNR